MQIDLTKKVREKPRELRRSAPPPRLSGDLWRPAGGEPAQVRSPARIHRAPRPYTITAQTGTPLSSNGVGGATPKKGGGETLEWSLPRYKTKPS